ncbi:MAG: hypothetical protein MR215_00560, partial [Bacteroidales bacterium]|nr:hypothetical protein [Bacteroidales bacterium]
KQTQKTHNRFNDRKTLIFKHIDTHNGDASVGMGSYVKIWGLMKEPCAAAKYSHRRPVSTLSAPHFH